MTKSINYKKYKEKKKCWDLLIFAVPAIIIALIFTYTPMVGLIMAFKKNIDFSSYANPFIAMFAADGAGFEQFGVLFANDNFLSALRNTLVISVLKIVIVFPIPIFLAILVTEIKHRKVQNVVQSISYLPHFLSWAIVSTIFISILRIDEGSLNLIFKLFGFGQVDISNPNHFRGVIIWTTAWKDVGWSMVTYIAAISAIDQSQYEAARMDGANKFQEIIHITLPSMASTIAVLLIMRIGYIMDAGFEQVQQVITPTAEPTGQIIGTLIYQTTIKNATGYEFSTAAGLFNSVISLILILAGNKFSKKFFNRGII